MALYQVDKLIVLSKSFSCWLTTFIQYQRVTDRQTDRRTDRQTDGQNYYINIARQQQYADAR